MKNPKIRLYAPIILILTAVVLYFTLFNSGDDSLYSVSGTVEAREVDIGPKIAGRIDAILLDEGDEVTKGQLLLQMDDRRLKIRVERANAALRAAEETLKDIEAGARKEEIAAANATMEAALAGLKKAKNDQKRAKELFDEGAASKDFLEKSELMVENSQKNYDTAREKLALLRSGARVNIIKSAEYKVEEARRAVDELQLLQTDSRTFSPIDGIVTIRSAEPGEVIGAGTPVLTLINPADCYLKIYISEIILARVSIGQDVAVFTDSFPDKPFSGKLIYISNRAEFTPRNIQTKDERVKLVYSAKIKIENSDLRFKPGMPVDVEIPLEEISE